MKIKALREAGLRAEHVAFSFMKRRVQPLMDRDTLEYQYTGNEDMSRMPSEEVDDEDIIERLGKTFKDMPPYTPCPVPEFSMARPPNQVHIYETSALEYFLEGELSCSRKLCSAGLHGQVCLRPNSPSST
jgi:hypothetical protein